MYADVDLAETLYKRFLLGSNETLPAFRYLFCDLKKSENLNLLQGGNPAIYVNKSTAKVAVKFQMRDTIIHCDEYVPGSLPKTSQMDGQNLKHTDILCDKAAFESDSEYDRFRRRMILIHEMTHGYMEATFNETMEQDAYGLELGTIVALSQRDAVDAARDIGLTKHTLLPYLKDRVSQYSQNNKKWEPFWYYTHTLPFYSAMREFHTLFELPELAEKPSAIAMKWHALLTEAREIDADLRFEINVEKHVVAGRLGLAQAKRDFA